MGKDGSQWHHNWTPANTAAVRLKLHQAVNGTSRPGQRQQRLKDVKPTPGSFLPLPSPLNGKPSTAKTAKPKTTTAKPKAPRKPAKPKQPAKTTEQRVHDAVTTAAKNANGIYSGDSVTVADARDTATLAGVKPADFDTTLMKLHDSGKVMVTSSNASNLLTPRQRTGGIKFGGVDNQIISLG